MRRSAPVLVLWCLLMAAAVTAPVAGAQEQPAGSGADTVDGTATGSSIDTGLPAGFTDGVPVGGTDAPDRAASTDASDGAARRSAAASAAAAATTTRYFGRGPWDAINAATSAATRCAALTGPQLTALVVSPIFKESSAATSASTAPAPMTLSRYDEWTGTRATDTNKNANYGLYAFQDPYTAYQRAFWHPGIGIWQYDSAGVGAPYTAVERMDVRVVAADVAAGMAARYCNPPPSIVGHPAPFTDQDRRDAAFWPWWAGSPTNDCPLCQAEYDKMTASSPYFANISLVDGITATGGASQRTCRLAGVAGTVTCWYVNPSVGVIQGATGWATLVPDGYGNPTVAPTPLSKPFYVIKRNGYEERHWIRADTGYAIDISGKRLLDKNERPRSNQAGSGVTWAGSSGLCDQTNGRGNCGTTPPANPVPAPSGITSVTASVGGLYRPISFDVNGDRKGDVLWYAPGAGADSIWLGQGAGRFTSVGTTIGSVYDDVVPLDANGDGKDDLLFYVRATGRAYVWLSKGNGTFTSLSFIPGPDRRPVIGDYDADGRDDVLWYGSGTVGDTRWTWTGTTYAAKAITVDGVFQPFVGDFDHNGRDDIFWYAPGAAADRLWLHASAGGYVSKVVTVGGAYQPLVGDFNGDRFSDIVWYAPGGAADAVWFGAGAAAFTSQSLTVTDTYQPVVVDLDGNGRDDVVWHKPNSTVDLWTRWAANRDRSSVSLAVTAPHQAVAGAFSANGGDGIFWYAPGTTIDALWYR